MPLFAERILARPHAASKLGKCDPLQPRCKPSCCCTQLAMTLTEMAVTHRTNEKKHTALSEAIRSHQLLQ